MFKINFARPSILIAVLLWLIGLINLGICVFSFVLSQKVENRSDLAQRGIEIEECSKHIFNSSEKLDSLLSVFVQNDDTELGLAYEAVEAEIVEKIRLIEVASENVPTSVKSDLARLANEILKLNRQIAEEKKAQGRQKALFSMVSMKHRTLISDTWEAYGIAKETALKYVGEQNKYMSSSINKFRWLDVLALLLNAFLIGLVWWLYVTATRRRREIQRSLLAAKEEAEQASLLKEQFMTNMSHEIRTPLNGILGFSRRLGHTVLTPIQREALYNIEFSGERLLSIVNDILDYSRLEANMMGLEAVPFSLFDLVQSLEKLFALKAQDKRLTLAIEIGEDVPDMLVGDPTRLTQTISNLLSNAIKFTQRGKVTLRVSVLSSDGVGKYQLQFEVEDTGIGVDEDKLDTIFERFRQAEDSTTRIYGGTGLGLSIVKQAVDLMGGKIRVESAPNRGSKFTISLTFAASEAGTVLGSPDVTTIPSESAKDFATKLILIVEDNNMNATLAGAILSDWGIRYDVAENGLIAIDMLRVIQYDLILMDIQMPDMDGVTTTAVVRKELNLRIPIIAMSANVAFDDKEKYLQAGMNDFLPKPFLERNLLGLLVRHLGNTSDEKNGLETISKPQEDDGPISINKQKLRSIARGKPAFLQQMASIFIKQYPTELAALCQALQLGQWSEVKAISHNMKTTTGYMGLQDELWTLLSQMEEIGQHRTPDTQKAAEVFRQLEKRSQLALIFVRDEIIVNKLNDK